MKKRNGFVSNSSSSSFIVRFDEDPTNPEKLREMMGECGTQTGWSHYGYELTTDQVFDTVNKDVQRFVEGNEWGACTIEQFVEAQHGWDFDYDAEEYYNHTRPWTDEPDYSVLSEEEQNHIIEIVKKRKIAEYRREVPDGGHVLVFSYADEDGQFGSLMEHGNIFRNVNHVRYSFH